MLKAPRACSLPLLCVAVGVACAVFAVPAQASGAKPMHLRVFAVAQRAHAVQSYRDLWSETWHAGITRDAIHSLGLGAGLEWPVGGRFSLGAEIVLVRKGWQQSDESWSHLRYVEAPLLVRLNLAGSDSGAALYLLGGGSVALFLSGESNASGTPEPIESDAIAGNDLSWFAGAGLRLPLGTKLTPFAEIRLQDGLRDVDQAADVRTKNVGVAFLAGLRF